MLTTQQKQLLARLASASAEAKKAEAKKAELLAEALTFFTKEESGYTTGSGARLFYQSASDSTRLDTAMVAEKYPEVAMACQVPVHKKATITIR